MPFKSRRWSWMLTRYRLNSLGRLRTTVAVRSFSGRQYPKLHPLPAWLMPWPG